MTIWQPGRHTTNNRLDIKSSLSRPYDTAWYGVASHRWSRILRFALHIAKCSFFSSVGFDRIAQSPQLYVYIYWPRHTQSTSYQWQHTIVTHTTHVWTWKQKIAASAWLINYMKKTKQPEKKPCRIISAVWRAHHTALHWFAEVLILDRAAFLLLIEWRIRERERENVLLTGLPFFVCRGHPDDDLLQSLSCRSTIRSIIH